MWSRLPLPANALLRRAWLVGPTGSSLNAWYGETQRDTSGLPFPEFSEVSIGLVIRQAEGERQAVCLAGSKVAVPFVVVLEWFLV